MSEQLEVLDSGGNLVRSIPAQPMARPQPTVAEMLQSVLSSPEALKNVAAVEQMVKLYEHMQDRDAAKSFAVAFTELQKEIPKVKATKAVPDKYGGVKYMVAPFEDIDDQLRPLALKHGFSYSFSEGPSQAGRICKLCIVQHVGGHQRSNPYSVRIGSGPPGATESQADGSAHSYAKRGAMCDAFSVVISHQDDDARAEGGSITPEQALDLRTRLKNVHGDEVAFLKFAGTKSFEEISSVKFDMLAEFMAKKERSYMQKLEAGK